jgi:hypothetical protein
MTDIVRDELGAPKIVDRSTFQLAGLQQRSGIFTTWAQITCVIRLIGNDQS